MSAYDQITALNVQLLTNEELGQKFAYIRCRKARYVLAREIKHRRAKALRGRS